MTIFSGINGRVEAPLENLLEAVPGGAELLIEWFAWLLSELRAEATRFPDPPGRRRYCYLIVERAEGPGYVQFAAGADGSLLSEASSNQSLGVDAVSRDDRLLLEAMGWDPPASGACGPRPNFSVDDAAMAVGRIAFMTLRALVDVFDVALIQELNYAYFDAFRDVGGGRGERIAPPEPKDPSPQPRTSGSSPKSVVVLPSADPSPTPDPEVDAREGEADDKGSAWPSNADG